MILSLSCFSLAVALYAIKDLQSHGKLRWMDYNDNFWGENSYYRKYTSIMQPPLDNWYYRLFKIGYKERWPTSATFTVFLTDGWHLCQFLFTILFCISAVSYETIVNRWVDGCIYWGVWKLVFWIVYNSLQKKKK